MCVCVRSSSSMGKRGECKAPLDGYITLRLDEEPSSSHSGGCTRGRGPSSSRPHCSSASCCCGCQLPIYFSKAHRPRTSSPLFLLYYGQGTPYPSPYLDHPSPPPVQPQGPRRRPIGVRNSAIQPHWSIFPRTKKPLPCEWPSHSPAWVPKVPRL